MKRIAFFLAIVSCGLESCNKSNELDFNAQLAMDIATIDDYLASHFIAATPDSSGIRYSITATGNGIKPAAASRVTIKYRARFLSDNQIFYTTPTGVVVDLNTAIPALQIAIPLMTKGSAFTLYIPSGLGFGTAGASPTVPANANLIYEVQLIDDDAQLVADVAAIDAFLLNTLQTNPDSIHKDPSGLRYVFALKGTGNKAISTSIITVTYTGKYLPSQQVFTQQTNSDVQQLNQLIRGWQIGIPLIPSGSQVTLYIPSALGYGPEGSSNGVITPNTNLIFDIHLIAVN